VNENQREPDKLKRSFDKASPIILSLQETDSRTGKFFYGIQTCSQKERAQDRTQTDEKRKKILPICFDTTAGFCEDDRAADSIWVAAAAAVDDAAHPMVLLSFSFNEIESTSFCLVRSPMESLGSSFSIVLFRGELRS